MSHRSTLPRLKLVYILLRKFDHGWTFNIRKSYYHLEIEDEENAKQLVHCKPNRMVILKGLNERLDEETEVTSNPLQHFPESWFNDIKKFDLDYGEEILNKFPNIEEIITPKDGVFSFTTLSEVIELMRFVRLLRLQKISIISTDEDIKEITRKSKNLEQLIIRGTNYEKIWKTSSFLQFVQNANFAKDVIIDIEKWLDDPEKLIQWLRKHTKHFCKWREENRFTFYYRANECINEDCYLPGCSSIKQNRDAPSEFKVISIHDDKVFLFYAPEYTFNWMTIGQLLKVEYMVTSKFRKIIDMKIEELPARTNFSISIEGDFAEISELCTVITGEKNLFMGQFGNILCCEKFDETKCSGLFHINYRYLPKTERKALGTEHRWIVVRYSYPGESKFSRKNLKSIRNDATYYGDTHSDCELEQEFSFYEHKFTGFLAEWVVDEEKKNLLVITELAVKPLNGFVKCAFKNTVTHFNTIF